MLMPSIKVYNDLIHNSVLFHNTFQHVHREVATSSKELIVDMSVPAVVLKIRR